ncbi:hypothetical protein AVEN_100931-1 [Araneus ventricosus]|uniref:Uncharacterized protein n=1 Tax=Araneus ventricosus TaxID=182803 RepID=A0A4Y2AYZ5_ARAVE|nr:hypothetical protein AVEN_100931-1 [Araneus ventricosus]
MCKTYDPEKNTWISLPAPNVFRQCLFLKASREKVFVIPANYSGGPRIIEMYDSKQKTWISLPELPFRYLLLGAVIVDNEIMVYENNPDDYQCQDVAPPVYWDESTQLWRIIEISSPWFHIERYSVLLLDDYSVVKDITAKNKCPGNKWERIISV